MTKDLPPPPDMRANEQVLAAIQDALREREFGSIDEMNAFLQGKLAAGGFPKKASTTPSEKAQDIMHDAWSATGKERVELAHRALSVFPDCADAYVLLAEESADITEAIRLLEEGVRAGERALGEQMFSEEAGNFWGILETRPYMRARFDLAHLMWHVGKREEAIAHMQELLRLNPGDNQGIRLELAACLLAERKMEALQILLDQYPDEYSADWYYTRALVKFLHVGRTPETDAGLAAAFEQNPYVPLFLLGKKRLPAHMPEYISIGHETEAVSYVAGNGRTWLEAPGALMWMRRLHATSRKRPVAKKLR